MVLVRSPAQVDISGPAGAGGAGGGGLEAPPLIWTCGGQRSKNFREHCAPHGNGLNISL